MNSTVFQVVANDANTFRSWGFVTYRFLVSSTAILMHLYSVLGFSGLGFEHFGVLWFRFLLLDVHWAQLLTLQLHRSSPASLFFILGTLVYVYLFYIYTDCYLFILVYVSMCMLIYLLSCFQEIGLHYVYSTLCYRKNGPLIHDGLTSSRS